MMNVPEDAVKPHHMAMSEPSAWVQRFATLIPAGGTVLDLACGGGRHTRFLLDRGYGVVAVDRTVEFVADLKEISGAEVIQADLEDGSPWPLAGRTFDGIVVVNYLYRPLFPHLLDSLKPGGVLIYETFARGNEELRRPRNPDHLLRGGELLDLVRGTLQVVAYEHGVVEVDPCPGVKQLIVGVNDLGTSAREDGEPEPHSLTP